MQTVPVTVCELDLAPVGLLVQAGGLTPPVRLKLVVGLLVAR